MGELEQRILRLKKELNAVIVAHNYQRPEVQEVADFCGDSLELARQCSQLNREVIVFCGVHFMAETAAILNPERKVLLAEATAGCPMADMVTVAELRQWKARYPEAAVVCYVNTSAAVKAESDICCTSANAVKVVNSLPNREILFLPDQNLGHYIATQSRKQFILYPGFCPPHRRLKPEQVKLARELYPQAKVMVHPECVAEVIALADAVLSTSQMVYYAKASEADEFLVGTEEGLLHRLRRENPGKSFRLIGRMVCKDMKKTTLESIIRAMELQQNIIAVPEEVRVRAKSALDRMLKIGAAVG